jgi:hypothetical protein
MTAEEPPATFSPGLAPYRAGWRPDILFKYSENIRHIFLLDYFINEH